MSRIFTYMISNFTNFSNSTIEAIISLIIKQKYASFESENKNPYFVKSFRAGSNKGW